MEALAQRGITAKITYLPADTACAPGRYTALDTPDLTPLTSADDFKIIIPAGAVSLGETFVLSAAVELLNNGVRAVVEFGITAGPIAACVPVDARWEATPGRREASTSTCPARPTTPGVAQPRNRDGRWSSRRRSLVVMWCSPPRRRGVVGRGDERTDVQAERARG